MKESELQREILQAIGKERRWKEPAKRKLKDGREIHFEREVGDGLFIRPNGLFFRVNSGAARGFSGNMLKLAPKGTADIIGIVSGIPVAIEVKVPGRGRQSKDQREWQDLWESRGGKYVVVRCVDDAVDFVCNGFAERD